jgi:hypothetical protein
MHKEKVSELGFQGRNRHARVRSLAWGKSLAVSCGAFIMAVSCSNATEVLTVPNNAASKKLNSTKTTDQISSSSAISLELAQADASTAPTDLLRGFAHLSFVDNNLLVGSSALATGSLTVAEGKINAQPPQPVPAFAAGKMFLPLRADGAEFWIVESPEGKTNIIRSSEPAAVPLGQALPKSVNVTLDSPASLIGFSKRALVLTTSSSLWIVEFSNGQLIASSVAFPSKSFSPIAAGNLSGSERSFWVAEAKTLWSFIGDSDNWSIRKSDLKVSIDSLELKKLAAVIELANGKPKLSGPAVAVGDKVYLAGISAPKLNPTTTPATPNVGAMTFAEAAARCDRCHASTSTNAPAKAKLTGTENISTWVNSKEEIIASVRDGIMPPGPGLMEPNKTRFLNFAQDPKP